MLVPCFTCFGDSDPDPLRDAMRNTLQTQLEALFSLLWNFSLGGVANLLLLGQNAESLDREMDELKETRDDLERRVSYEEAILQRKRTPPVKGWLQRVERLEAQVAEFRDTFESRGTAILKCLSLAYDAVDKLKQVRYLRSQRTSLGDELVGSAPPEAVQDIPISTTASSVVGREKALSAIEGYLEVDAVGIIGIYGVGGIGKTTLLKVIHKGFLDSGARGFEVVIFVTIPRNNSNMLKIQKDVGKRVGLALSADKSGPSDQEEEQADLLFKALSKKKFLLLLDDVREDLDLNKIGIPSPSSDSSRKGSKIVFTALSKKICNRMNAQRRVEMLVLDKEESWKLFSEKVGAEVDLLDPSILPIAEKVVEKCGGLPRTLVRVGQAMAEAKTVMEWRVTLESLNDSPIELSALYMEAVDTLYSPGQLNAGESLTNRNYRFTMQTDGNLVLFEYNRPVWASGMSGPGRTNCRLTMQDDGNLVVYNGTILLWCSNVTGPTGNYRLVLHLDGNVVVYNSENKALWSTRAHIAMSTLYSPGNLNAGESLTNSNYRFTLQTDGNLVLFEYNRPVWASGTNGPGRTSCRLVMQDDGNLVLYDDDSPLWSSKTAGPIGKYRLVLQADRNVVIYNNENRPLWATGTYIRNDP